MLNILLVEDDEKLGKALQKGLVDAGHECRWERTGPAGLDAAVTVSPDVIVLDRMLPDLSGLDLLKTLRNQADRTPVLMLTALGSIEDRVAGLDAGADDYLVKPFAFPELLARLTAVTRRVAPPPSQSLTTGSLSLDLASRRVMRNGKQIDVTPTEFSLLELLMRNEGHVVTRKMLCEHLWDASWEGVTNVIEVHVTRLRAKIDRDFDVALLQTVRGRGYRLVSDSPVIATNR